MWLQLVWDAVKRDGSSVATMSQDQLGGYYCPQAGDGNLEGGWTKQRPIPSSAQDRHLGSPLWGLGTHTLNYVPSLPKLPSQQISSSCFLLKQE